MLVQRLAIATMAATLGGSYTVSAAGAKIYTNVDAFVHTVPGAVTAEIHGSYGELSNSGRNDWAGIIYFDSTDHGRMRQIVILTQGTDRRYRLAAQVDPIPAGEDTGHTAVEGVEIKKGSVFITSSWHWNGCGGGAVHQYKYYKGKWRLIGVTFTRSNARDDGDGFWASKDIVEIDRNMLTGNTLVHYRPWHKKPVEMKLHLTSETLLFAGYNYEAGKVSQFDADASCEF